jgi:hypothetical protein
MHNSNVSSDTTYSPNTLKMLIIKKCYINNHLSHLMPSIVNRLTTQSQEFKNKSNHPIILNQMLHTNSDVRIQN